MTPLLLIGGGGHCRSCIDVIENEARFDIAGIVQPKEEDAGPVLGYRILGNDADLPDLLIRFPTALITVGQIKTPSIRMRLYELLKTLGARLPAIISPHAHISRHATFDEGTIVMHGVIVNAGARIGANNIINSQALIEHDALIEAHCHISTGARINGGVVIGTGCFIGSGAILREGVRIGSNSVIGAGRIVLRDLPPNTLLRGGP